MRVSAAVVVILAALGCSNSLLSQQYQHSVQLDDMNKKYMLYWSHNSSESAWMYFAVEVQTTGWVAVGFADKIGGMKDYDVVISYVSPQTSSTEFQDCLTNGQHTPPVDDHQNYYLKGSSEVDGKTTIQFKRKLDTGDSKDHIIKPGDMHIVWSYGKYDDITQKHYDRGHKTLKLLSGVPSIAHAASWVLPLVSFSQIAFWCAVHCSCC